MTVRAGDVIAGRYRVDVRLGRGGMAVVYAAIDLVLGRSVAVKVPSWHPDDEPRAAERFRREARAAAALDHPNVVTVFDVADHDGVPVLVMEHVDGPTLATRLGDGGPLPIASATEIAAQISDALAAAHASGVVHRDVKPSNVLVAADGAARLSDFGIARAAEASMTMTSVHGSAGYIAPEQARGERPDPRSDLYALGCTLFEMLTGRPPFTGDTVAAVLSQQLHATPPAVRSVRSDVPADLDELITRLLAKHPAARPSTAADVSARLRQFAGDGPAVASASTAGTRTLVPAATTPVATDDAAVASSRSTPSRRAVVAAVITPALAAAAYLGIGGSFARPAPAAQNDAPGATAASAGGDAPAGSTAADDDDAERGDAAGGVVAGRTANSSADDAPPTRSERIPSPVTPIRRLVVQGHTSGRVSARGVDEIEKHIAEVVKQRREGNPDDAAEKVDKLRDTLAKLVEEGDADPSFARHLQARLSALADAAAESS